MISRNDRCWCGSGKKWKHCHFPSPPEKTGDVLREFYQKSFGIILKTPEQIEGIRQASKLASRILDEVCSIAKAGVTTNELDALAVRLHKEFGAKAASKGYGTPPFPKSICTSLNDVICHGIPDDVPLKNGDILNVDIASILNGYYGDCSKMVVIGEVSEEKRRVVDVSYECLYRACAILRPGLPILEIGNEIEKYARAHGCSVVNQFVAHGVGVNFHEAPEVPHHYNQIKTPLAEGMTFTIEPMINAGVRGGYIEETNEWVARTLDGKPSAQWEHTVLITANGYEILTSWTR